MTVMRARGWRSDGALQRAKQELLQAGFMMVSRKGGRHRPDLLAVTFYNVNECLDKNGLSKLEINPTHAPTNDWLRDTPVPNIDEARKRKKKAELIELQDYLNRHPDAPYADNMRLGVKTLQAQINYSTPYKEQ